MNGLIVKMSEGKENNKALRAGRVLMNRRHPSLTLVEVMEWSGEDGGRPQASARAPSVSI